MLFGMLTVTESVKLKRMERCGMSAVIASVMWNMTGLSEMRTAIVSVTLSLMARCGMQADIALEAWSLTGRSEMSTVTELVRLNRPTFTGAVLPCCFSSDKSGQKPDEK
ncbi:MAG: hypothetical protein PVTTEEND_001999 [Candidatus Fervidibacter sp.]